MATSYTEGDMVISINNCSGAIAGQTYRVISYAEGFIIPFQLEGTDCSCGYWTPVEKKIMTTIPCGGIISYNPQKFKVGDRVRIVKRNPNNMSGAEPGWNTPNGNVGAIGNIKEIDPNKYNVWEDNKYFGWFEADEIELAAKFKVGDKVRVYRNKDRGDNSGVGTIFTITKIYKDFNEKEDYSAYGDPDGGSWSFHNLELIDPMTFTDLEKFHNGYVWQNYIPLTKPYEELKQYNYSSSLPRLFKRKESKMNNIFQAIKAKMSPTDRTLVKHGYLNSDGTRSSMYEDQLREMAIKKLMDAEDTADFRAELASELKQDEE